MFVILLMHSHNETKLRCSSTSTVLSSAAHSFKASLMKSSLYVNAMEQIIKLKKQKTSWTPETTRAPVSKLKQNSFSDFMTCGCVWWDSSKAYSTTGGINCTITRVMVMEDSKKKKKKSFLFTHICCYYY